MGLTGREREALRHAIGGIEEVETFPRGVGNGTIAGLVERGMLIHGVCPEYHHEGYRTTKTGLDALDRQ